MMMPEPRAVYAAFDVFPRAKGSSSHIASMVQALARNFGAVRLLCLGAPDLPSAQREGAIEILRYWEPRTDLLARATGFAGFVRRYAEPLRRAELAVFRDPWGGVPLLDALPGIPSVFEVNALPQWELSYSYPSLFTNPSLRAKLGDMARRCLDRASRILCVSSVTAAALVKEGAPESAIAVIPNVAHDVFFAAPDVPCPIAALDVGRWIGYIGGLQPWQGVGTVIDAMARLRRDLPDHQLLILRGDSERHLPEIERRIARQGLSQRVLIQDPVATAEVAAVLRRLEIAVVPLADTPRNTSQGCCPIKLVEAMATGAPVIASDLAVCRQWIRHGDNGWLAAADDSRAWALAIHHLAAEPALRQRLANAARSFAIEHFSWDVVHGQLDVVFQSSVGLQSREIDFNRRRPDASQTAKTG